MRKDILLSLLSSAVLAENYTVPDGIFLEANYTQMINHSDASIGTFNQRYFYTTAFIDNTTGPDYAFLYICGEGTCNPPNEHGFAV